MNQAACNDGDLCTTGDFCHLGECTAAGVLNCNDNNLCTDDGCLPAAGCIFSANSAACDDKNACTLGDKCSDGWCTAGAPILCEDNNPCTDAACNPATGCLFVANSEPCSDGNLCTVDDKCSQSECLSGAPLTCNDDNPCTDDSCQADTGCLFTPNGAFCSDGNSCTNSDTCDGGICSGTPVDCSDDNVCTDDSCNENGDCDHLPNSANCPGGQCAGGVCVPDCVPDCQGKTCGDDGCGGSCGTCQQNFACVAGNCQSSLTKRVFVTSQVYNAGLGGVTGADSKCQSVANSAGLGGSWKAWISQPSGSSSPASRFAKSDGPYVLLDNTVIATSWTDLTDGTLLHGIDRTEFNQPEGSGSYVWTATTTNGAFNTGSWGGCGGTVCNNFSNGSTCLPCGSCGGFGGKAGASGKGWTDEVCGCCDNTWRLYCFEQ